MVHWTSKEWRARACVSDCAHVASSPFDSCESGCRWHLSAQWRVDDASVSFLGVSWRCHAVRWFSWTMLRWWCVQSAVCPPLMPFWSRSAYLRYRERRLLHWITFWRAAHCARTAYLPNEWKVHLMNYVRYHFWNWYFEVRLSSFPIRNQNPFNDSRKWWNVERHPRSFDVLDTLTHKKRYIFLFIYWRITEQWFRGIFGSSVMHQRKIQIRINFPWEKIPELKFDLNRMRWTASHFRWFFGQFQNQIIYNKVMQPQAKNRRLIPDDTVDPDSIELSQSRSMLTTSNPNWCSANFDTFWLTRESHIFHNQYPVQFGRNIFPVSMVGAFIIRYMRC